MTGWAIFSVVSLLVLFGGLTWFLRRFAGVNTVGPIKVSGHRRLDVHHALWIVEVDGERLLVGGGRGSVTLVKALAPAEARSKGA